MAKNRKLVDLLPEHTGVIKCHCDGCSWKGTEDDLDPIKDVQERVSAGEFMALGQCPKCGDLISSTNNTIPTYTLEDAVNIIAIRARGEAKKLAVQLGDLLKANHKTRDAINQAKRLALTKAA